MNTSLSKTIAMLLTWSPEKIPGVEREMRSNKGTGSTPSHNKQAMRMKEAKATATQSTLKHQ